MRSGFPKVTEAATIFAAAIVVACSSSTNATAPPGTDAGSESKTNTGGANTTGAGGASATGTGGRPMSGAGGTGAHSGSDAGLGGTNGGAAHDASARESGSGTTDGSADATASCPPPTLYGGGETSMSNLSVTAAVVDETGAPVVGQPAFICGINLCSPPATTDAAGKVSMQWSMSEERPAFKVGDAVHYAEIAIPLAKPVTDLTVGGGVVVIGKLSDKPGATLTPGASAISGDVTIGLAKGTTVGIDGLTYDTSDTRKFRAVSIPVAKATVALGELTADSGGGTFVLFYGVAPSDTPFCPAASVSVALPHTTQTPNNDFGWAPGTAVEFWITTIDVGQFYAPYAGWSKMSDGAVSADGKTAVTSPGQGFAVLDSFVIRKAP